MKHHFSRLVKTSLVAHCGHTVWAMVWGNSTHCHQGKLTIPSIDPLAQQFYF